MAERAVVSPSEGALPSSANAADDKPAPTMCPQKGQQTDDVFAEFLSQSAILALKDEWRDLGACAVEHNPFFSPALLIPALAHLSGREVQFACVFDRDGAGRRLVGFAPLKVEKSYDHLPITVLKSWVYEHCFYDAPLVRPGYEVAVFAAFGRLLDEHPDRPSLLRFSRIAEDGALAKFALQATDEKRVIWRTRGHERALLAGGFNAEEHINSSVRKKKRKEIKRQRNRLAEIGAVEFQKLASHNALNNWIEDFLALEKSGWKGDAASALASTESGGEFFREAVTNAYQDGSLEFYRLAVDEKPAAMIVNFVDRGQGYSFKICHDPSYARFSPGVLLELDLLRALSKDRTLKFIDSCASENHSMINRLWCERREIIGFNVSASRRTARGLHQVIRFIEALLDKIKRRPAQTEERSA